MVTQIQPLSQDFSLQSFAGWSNNFNVGAGILLGGEISYSLAMDNSYDAVGFGVSISPMVVSGGCTSSKTWIFSVWPTYEIRSLDGKLLWSSGP